MQLTITLTDYEARVLSAEYVNIDFLFQSQLEGRINEVQNNIVQKVVKHCTDNGLTIPSTTAEIVELGFTAGVVSVLSERDTSTPPSPSEGE